MDHMGVAMDSTSRDIERDCAFGGLFQQIINEMKNSSPLWEDLTMKSTKLHSCLRATIQAVSAFLETFQKIADAATSTKGATKDIGTALTRICLRHKALEAKLKTFTSSIFDCLIIPLQERLEEWKRVTINLDKEHAKEYKRGRAELKKRSVETLRLQKKMRKIGAHNGGTFSGSGSRPSRSGSGMSNQGIYSGGESYQQQSGSGPGGDGGIRDLHRILEIAMKDTNEKRQGFEEMEKQAIRTALIEERSRFCLFVSFFKPVVDEEIEMLSELTHVQEAMQQLEKHAMDPFSFPASSEQVIADLKGSCDSGTWSFQTPPSSPSSLGSRKSSLCSISSANSSSSGSMHSPPHNFLYPNQNQHPHSAVPHRITQKVENQSEESNSPGSSNSSTPSLTYAPGTVTAAAAAWPNVQDSLQFERAACAIMNERPHTISSAYDRGQESPSLTMYTNQNQNQNPGQLRHSISHPASPSPHNSSAPVTPLVESSHGQGAGSIYQSATEIYGALRGRNESKPPVPKRASSLERVPSEFDPEPEPQVHKPFHTHTPQYQTPITPIKPSRKPSKSNFVESQSNQDKNVPALPDFNQSSPDMIVPQPVYVNMHELNQMAAARRLRQHELPPPPPELMANKIQQLQNQTQGQSQGMYEDHGQFNRGNTQPMGAAVEANYEAPQKQQLQSQSQEPPPPAPRQSQPQEPPPPAPRQHQQQEQQPQLQQAQLRPQDERPQPPTRQAGTTLSASASPVRSQPSTPTQANQGIFQQYTSSPQPHASSWGSSPTGGLENYGGEHQREIRSNSLDEALKHINVAEAIKTLTERNHQPVSPNMSQVRRAHSLKQTDEKVVTAQAQQAQAHPHAHPTAQQQDTAALSQQGQSQGQPQRNTHGPSHGVNSGITSNMNSYPSAAAAAAALKEREKGGHGHGHSHGQGHGHNQKVTPGQGSPVLQPQPEPQSHQHPPAPGPRAMTVAMAQQLQHQQQQQRNSVAANPQTQHQPQPLQQQQQQQRNSMGAAAPQMRYQPQPLQVQQQPHSNPLYQQIVNQNQQLLQHHHHQQQQQQPVYQQLSTTITTAPQSQSAQHTPRNTRRFSEELLKSTASFVQNHVLGNRTPPPVVSSKEMFVQTLNAKLSQMRASPPTERRMSSPTLKTSLASKLVASVTQHHGHRGSSPEMSTAFRVRQWIASKTISDPNLCRESLMDQIRHYDGRRLRHIRAINDRSAPRIR